ncbi:hypothetical protein [Paenibacillus elgii]|uniref:hypothetical protein n=1 Tax=Paenibacillus elgii TaxID=189691 RepID=UPI000248D2F2|nr:hypothetical protein [Paenibacillus elgii]
MLIPGKIKPAEEPDIPFPFGNSEISTGNLIRLTDSVLMPFEAKESGGKCGEYYRSYVKLEQISEILSLPLAEPYDDFYDEDKGGFWCGSVHARFAGHIPHSAVCRQVLEGTGLPENRKMIGLRMYS